MDPVTKYYNAIAKRLDSGPSTNKDTTKKVQDAVYECLDQYAKGKINELPQDMVYELATSMRDILHGITPDLFKTHRKRGDKSQSPTIEDFIKDAVKYVRWAKAGLITEDSPINTVAENYGVAIRTARGWVANKKFSCIEAPAESNVTEIDKRRVKIIMESSGYHYQHTPTASSQQAIRNRTVK